MQLKPVGLINNKMNINIMRKYLILSLAIILISFITSIYLYPQFPDEVPSHWNARGEVDGYMPKFWGLFLIPLISIGILLLFILIPRIDPLKRNIKKFMNYYEGFIILMMGFLFYIYLLMIVWTLGYAFDMNQMIILPIGILFIYIGFLLEKAKRNWFIGIRTPWTLSNDNVWEKTHKLSGKLFKALGIIILFAMIVPDYSLWIVLISVFGVTFYLIVYSYFAYQKETKKK